MLQQIERAGNRFEGVDFDLDDKKRPGKSKEFEDLLEENLSQTLQKMFISFGNDPKRRKLSPKLTMNQCDEISENIPENIEMNNHLFRSMVHG